MSRQNKRTKIKLTEEEKKRLEKIIRSTKEEVRKVNRAKIILLSESGESDFKIKKILGLHRATVKTCLDKCIKMGVETALKDLPRKGAPQEILDEDRLLVINEACKSPLELDYPYTLWTYSLLTEHIKNQAAIKGNVRLTQIAKSSVWNILNTAEIKPHRIRYYLEKRDKEFEKKMADLLCVYKEIEIINETLGDGENKLEKVTISYDEKPGIQAIGNTAKELMPVAGKHRTLSRDFEYKRYGTLSLLAGMNLHTGQLTHHISRTHKSSDFIDFLEKVDQQYSDTEKIRIILDNHSAHVSKQTRAYLSQRPNRFEFIFTPKHGSWLNLIEGFFSKMSRTVLRQMRVNSIEEVKTRIEKYFSMINKKPVVHRWKYKLDTI
jgi:transposase